MNNKKGFTLVELIVSFALITAVSLAFFRTILVLQQAQLKNIAKNSYKAFTVVLNNSIQKDFLQDNIEKIISCGENCYDITYTTNGIVRLSIDKENNTITYGNIKEKLPKDFKFINNIEFTSYINSYEGNDSYVALNLNIKSNYEKDIQNIKYVYQYDSDNGIIELDVDGAEASDIIEYLLYSSPEENGLYEPLLPDGTSTGIRYRGAFARNYVYFNCEDTYNNITYGNEDYDYKNACEVWRIIGVFDVDNGKGNIENRVKLVRNESIGQRAFDSNNLQSWENSDLKKYLNEDTSENYYNNLSNFSKNIIDDVFWNADLLDYYSKDKSIVYAYKSERNEKKVISKIGLINVSDYIYASSSLCTVITDTSCGVNNWLKPVSNFYWTLIPMPFDETHVWHISSGGEASFYWANKEADVRPSLYLKSNVTFIAEGNGTEESPYILGINE